jgi:mono/diheme cytochrome c family protein
MRNSSGHENQHRGAEVRPASFGPALLGLALLFSGCIARAAPPGKAQDNRLDDFPNKNTPEAAIYRGGIVFQNYCILCHGVKADGNGRAARLYNPRPANLVMSDKNDQYKELIIRRGGAMLGRSQFMPPWGEELTDEQISDVIAFLRSIKPAGP